MVPARWYGGATAYPLLFGVRQELAQCRRPGSAARVVESYKPELLDALRERFGPCAAQALTLKALNVCLARQEFLARATQVAARPAGLVVDPSNTCRLGCPGCVHSTPGAFDWPNATLTVSTFDRLLERFGPHAVGVYFCDYGEPLLNLATPRLIRAAKRYLLRTALSTSLSVQRFDPEQYVESGLDFMVIAIDGATQGVYGRFRRGGSLELALDNLRRLVEARRRLGRSTPVLCWNFLAFEHNVHELPAAGRLARDLGVDQFRVAHPFDVSWDDPEIRPAPPSGELRRYNWAGTISLAGNWNAFPDDLAAEPIARAFGDPWDSPHTADTPREPGHTCAWLYRNLSMDAAGRILPCCGAPKPGTNLVFGALDQAGDPFNTPMHRQARAFFRGDSPGTEAGAPHCPRCEWEQTAVTPGAAEIRRYFRSADASFFDRRSLALLAEW